MNQSIQLFSFINNQVIPADIELMSDSHLADFELFWKPRLQVTNEEDAHWDWVKKRNVTDVRPNYERYALVCEKITQGLMLLEVDLHRSRLNPGKNIVYIDFLSSAPWNRNSTEDKKVYKGVGVNFIAFAVNRSFDLGYKGRIGLHSLPKAEIFYRRLNMTDFGEDTKKQKLRYFEMSEDEAIKVISSD